MKRALWLALPLATACTPKEAPRPAAETAEAPEDTSAEIPAAEGEMEAASVENPMTVPDGDANGEPWVVVKNADFAVAVPDGWEEVPPPDGHVQLMRVGDGVGIPPIDEFGQPLQAGIIVEKRQGDFADGSALADTLLAGLEGDESVELTAPPARSEMILCDGTPAEFVVVGFQRPGEQRKSLFTQVFAGENGEGWIASGYLVSGPLSGVTEPDSLAATWMASHTMSFCPEPTAFDDSAVRVAYDALEQAMEEAMQEIEGDEGREPVKTGTERDIPDSPEP
jgi:hypothetical protein